MNNDTISRAAAVNLAMCYCPNDDGTCDKGGKDLRDLLDDLENLPPAQQWIPVTVKLPDESGTYLVTISYKDGGSDDTDLIWYSSHWREWNEGELSGGKVIAWQPKPKPWKGRQDDT